jgi:hypothetical protein
LVQPEDPDEAGKIVGSTLFGGQDVVQMPRYFRSWEQGLPKLRQQLARVDDLKGLSKAERQALRTRMSELRLAPGERNALLMWGEVRRVLVIFDPGTLGIRAILKP